MISYVRNLVILALTTVALSGCLDDSTSAHTVAWFKAHDTERQATAKECANNPGELHDDPSCVNARSAMQELSAGTPHNMDW